MYIPSALTSVAPLLHIEDDGKWASANTERTINKLLIHNLPQINQKCMLYPTLICKINRIKNKFYQNWTIGYQIV